jgi:serpin B
MRNRISIKDRGNLVVKKGEKNKMNKLKITAGIAALIMVTTTGCSLNKSAEIKSKYTIQEKELTASVDKISSANNRVAFKFLGETLKANNKENIVISPLSLNTVLALTQNGAAGSTKEQMLKALELQGLDDNTINESYKNVIAHFNSLKSIETKIGDSIWIRKNADVKKEFKDIGKNYYEAEINEIDFAKKNSVDAVNKWVANQTAGKINKILESFKDDTYMALINTVYFKGKWSNPFTESSTSKQKFTSSDGSTKDVDMMKESMGIDYIKNTNFEAIRIPYEDNNFGMYVFLPNKDSNVDSLMKEMTIENWNKWIGEFKKTQLQVSIPKFKIEFEEKLNDMLIGFGMKDAFGHNANFSNITEKTGLYVDLVKQKSYIDVNEAGIEAASATAVVIREVSAPVEPPTKFIADRPFIYAIADKKTGLILFMGKVEKP